MKWLKNMAEGLFVGVFVVIMAIPAILMGLVVLVVTVLIMLAAGIAMVVSLPLAALTGRLNVVVKKNGVEVLPWKKKDLENW